MALTVENLSFSYNSGKVLSDVSFSAYEGTLTAVMGPNGVGKTTLFRCILGLNRKHEGTIKIDGRNVGEMSVREQARNIAYIPQIHGMAFSFSVEDMVLMGTSHRFSRVSRPGKTEVALAREALERVGIGHLAERNFSKLSGGEQQLVLVARALVQGGRVLLMDEPTASLDYGNQTMVLAKAGELAKEGYTVLISTHNPQHALWFADKALAILDGKVLAFGTPEQVLNEELIYKLYGIKTDFVKVSGDLMIVPRREEWRHV